MYSSIEHKFKELSSPCMVFHIRHGDIKSEPSRRKYWTLDQYMEQGKNKHKKRGTNHMEQGNQFKPKKKFH